MHFWQLDVKSLFTIHILSSWNTLCTLFYVTFHVKWFFKDFHSPCLSITLSLTCQVSCLHQAATLVGHCAWPICHHSLWEAEWETVSGHLSMKTSTDATPAESVSEHVLVSRVSWWHEQKVFLTLNQTELSVFSSWWSALFLSVPTCRAIEAAQSDCSCKNKHDSACFTSTWSLH